MVAYYNEIDPFAAAWLKELIADGLIAAGDVDDRSIKDVQPDDLKGYSQCHFFAGIGGWSLALRLAGWPDDKPVWTGSCPCQPLSGAGQRKGHADERHLWPAFHGLIAQRQPPTVFGEQVASADGREWLAGIRADLETLGYAVGAADLCAAGIGAPHIRQRLYWLANTDGGGEHGRLGREGGQASQGEGQMGQQDGERLRGEPGRGGPDGGLADAHGGLSGDRRIQRRREHGQQPEDSGVGCGLDDSAAPRQPGDGIGGEDRSSRDEARMQEPAGRGASGGVGDPDQRLGRQGRPDARGGNQGSAALTRAGLGGYGSNVLIPCSDGKWRSVPANETGEPEPILFPLADAGAVRNRVGTLRGAGNAIQAILAKEFILASCEAL